MPTPPPAPLPMPDPAPARRRRRSRSPAAAGAAPRTLDRRRVDGRRRRARARCAAPAPTVTDRPRPCAEASRDWWPLAMTWALDGQVAGAGRRSWPGPPTPTRSPAVLRICNEAARPGHRGRRAQRRVRRVGPAVRRRRPRPRATSPASSTSTTRRCVVDVRAGHVRRPTSRTSCATDHGVTCGHWPQSMTLSTVGGWLACRGAGQFSTRYGKIEDMVVGLDVVLADGTRDPHRRQRPPGRRAPTSPSCSSAREGTLGVITGARLRLHPAPAARAAARPSAFAVVRRRARRLPPHPAPRRHAGGAAPLRRRSRRTAATRPATPAVLLVLDEGDAGAGRRDDRRVVDEECAAADAARRRASSSGGWSTATTCPRSSR